MRKTKGEKCVKKRKMRRKRGKMVTRGKNGKKKGKNAQKMRLKKGENHSDPIYTNPTKNLPTGGPKSPKKLEKVQTQDPLDSGRGVL